jgi:hypothetical protein
MPERKLGFVPPISGAAMMSSGDRLWDEQYRRYKLLERLKSEGVTHVAVGYGGGPSDPKGQKAKGSTIDKLMRDTKFKAGGVMGFYKREDAGLENPSPGRMSQFLLTLYDLDDEGALWPSGTMWFPALSAARSYGDKVVSEKGATHYVVTDGKSQRPKAFYGFKTSGEAERYGLTRNPSPSVKSAGEQKMTFEKLHEPFKAWLSEVASEHGKSVEQVFGWWREYTRDCRNYDQSPVESEFLDWYRDKLSASGGENPSPSARSSCGSLGGRGNPMGLHTRLVMAATDYDRKQGGKRGYNRYALAQYLGALQQAEQEIAGGSTARQALVSNFSGRLLDALLKAAGEPGAADEEVREAWNSAKSARGSSNPGERPVFIRKGRDIGRVLRWEGDKPVVRFAGDPNYDYRVSGGWRPAILSDFGELNKKGVAIGKRQTLGNFEREFAGTAIGYVYPPPYPRAMKGNPASGIDSGGRGNPARITFERIGDRLYALFAAGPRVTKPMTVAFHTNILTADSPHLGYPALISEKGEGNRAIAPDDHLWWMDEGGSEAAKGSLGSYRLAERGEDGLWEFRRKENPESGIKFVYGILGKGASRVSEVQSVLMDKARYTVAQAKKWLEDHGFKHGSVDKGGAKAGYLRFRQQDPGKYHSMRTGQPGTRNPSGMNWDNGHIDKYVGPYPAVEISDGIETYSANLPKGWTLDDAVDDFWSTYDWNLGRGETIGPAQGTYDELCRATLYTAPGEEAETQGFNFVERFEGRSIGRMGRLEENPGKHHSMRTGEQEGGKGNPKRGTPDEIVILRGLDSEYEAKTMLPAVKKSRTYLKGGRFLVKQLSGGGYGIVYSYSGEAGAKNPRGIHEFYYTDESGHRLGEQTTDLESGFRLGVTLARTNNMPVRIWIGSAQEESGWKQWGQVTPETTEEAIKRAVMLFALRGRQINPESQSAAALYEQFHGRPSSETLEYREEIEVPDELAGLGDLTEIKVATMSGLDVTLSFEDDPPKLCSTPDGRQLHLLGGDQSIPLDKLKMDSEKWFKDSMVLGILREVVYRTRKSFHKFVLTLYDHHMGEVTEVQPMLIYDTLNKTLSVSGGHYQVTAAGVEN